MPHLLHVTSTSPLYISAAPSSVYIGHISVRYSVKQPNLPFPSSYNSWGGGYISCNVIQSCLPPYLTLPISLLLYHAKYLYIGLDFRYTFQSLCMCFISITDFSHGKLVHCLLIPPSNTMHNYYGILDIIDARLNYTVQKLGLNEDLLWIWFGKSQIRT